MHNLVSAAKLRPDGSPNVMFQGAPYGSGVSFFMVDFGPDEGPPLHLHPYSETWVILSGEAIFTADGEEISVREGDIAVATAETPHKFVNTGSGRLKAVCIHDSPTIIQTNLE